MPVMPRTDKRATKIAYKIMGVPCNMRGEQKKKSEKDRALDYNDNRKA